MGKEIMSRQITMRETNICTSCFNPQILSTPPLVVAPTLHPTVLPEMLRLAGSISQSSPFSFSYFQTFQKEFLNICY